MCKKGLKFYFCLCMLSVEDDCLSNDRRPNENEAGVKKVLLIIVALLIATSALATPPSKILVKYDVYGGYGMAVIDALKAKWSAATITSYQGSTWGAFDNALRTGTWNIVIVEAHNYTSSSTSHYTNLASWYNRHIGPLFYADWGASGSYNNVLETAMGAGNPTRLAMPPRPHYAWVTTHAICTGITNWTYGHPSGYTTGGSAYPWTTATPVTGWTSTLQAGQGGIMVAPDKHSVISGYFPSLNTTQARKLWANILGFMWTGSTSVKPESLGKVKALYK